MVILYGYQEGRCEKCGFEGTIEYHHPDGKRTAYYYELPDGTLHKAEHDPRTPHKFITVRDEYIDPERVVQLCPICHSLVTRRGISFLDAGRMVNAFWDKKYESNRDEHLLITSECHKEVDLKQKEINSLKEEIVSLKQFNTKLLSELLEYQKKDCDRP